MSKKTVSGIDEVGTEVKAMVGLNEQLDHSGVTNKKVHTLYLDYTLPPPIYRSQVCTGGKIVDKTIGRVKEISRTAVGFRVVALSGEQYEIPMNRVMFYRED